MVIDLGENKFVGKVDNGFELTGPGGYSRSIRVDKVEGDFVEGMDVSDGNGVLVRETIVFKA